MLRLTCSSDRQYCHRWHHLRGECVQGSPRADLEDGRSPGRREWPSHRRPPSTPQPVPNHIRQLCTLYHQIPSTSRSDTSRHQCPNFILTLEEVGVLGEIGHKASGLRRLDFVSCQCPWLLAKALVEAMPQVEYIWEGGDEGVEKREDWIRRVDERRELYKTIW